MSNFSYLFQLKTKQGEDHYFTNSAQMIKCQEQQYLPYSGLAIESAQFNDSALNQIIISGLYEPKGMNQETDLVGGTVIISYYENGQYRLLFNYICTKQISENIIFKLICQPETIKLNQLLLSSFSKTCRANFCDQACGLNSNDFTLKIMIKEIRSNLIMCEDINKEDDYFANGKISIEDKQGLKHDYKIKKQAKNQLDLFTIVKPKLFNEVAFLIPGCDKTIRTCCYSFNNTVNFRGEPNIPEYKIIKN